MTDRHEAATGEVSGAGPTRPFDLRRLDLNLLVPLHALLVERSVSVAAQRLDLTQPALSKSLQKLRRHFGDELLVRAGRSYDLTPLAGALLPELEDLVQRLGGVLAPWTAFDPATTRRRFSLASSDYASVVLGPELAAELARVAPAASLDLVPLGDRPIHEQLASVDGAVVPPGLDGRLRDAVTLLTEQWAFFVDSSLADEAGSWTRQDFTARGFVATAYGDHVPARALLEGIGIEIDVRVTTSSFGAVAFLVAGTPYVGLAGSRLAARLAASAGVVIVEPPWEMPVIPYQLYSDRVRRQDPATRWFLDLVAEVVSRPQDGAAVPV